MTLKWYGKDVLTALEAAAVDGIDETTAAIVPLAKAVVPVRTAILQGSLRMEPARKVMPRRVVGRVGSFDVNYAVFVELGTTRMRARPYLRPAGDAEFPKLAERIKRRFRA
jgi:hypothetical protein